MKKIIGNLKNVSPATWARLAVLIAALVNNALAILGRAPVSDGGAAAHIVTVIVTVAAALSGYWKNNSFTPEAVAADEYLNGLKSGNYKNK